VRGEGGESGRKEAEGVEGEGGWVKRGGVGRGESRKMEVEGRGWRGRSEGERGEVWTERGRGEGREGEGRG